MAMSAYASGMYGFYSPYERGLQHYAPFAQLASQQASSSAGAAIVSFGGGGGAAGSAGPQAQLLALG